MPYHTIPSSRHAMTPPLPCSRRTGHAAATRRHACGHLPPSPVLASSLYGFTLQPVPGQRRLTSPSPRSFSIGGEEARRRGAVTSTHPDKATAAAASFDLGSTPKLAATTAGNHHHPTHTHTHTHSLTPQHHTSGGSTRPPPCGAVPPQAKTKSRQGLSSLLAGREQNGTTQPPGITRYPRARGGQGRKRAQLFRFVNIKAE
jgi:hypothetical protein